MLHGGCEKCTMHARFLHIMFVPQTGSQPVGFLLLVNDWLIVFRQMPFHGACLPGARLFLVNDWLIVVHQTPFHGVRLPACPANPFHGVCLPGAPVPRCSPARRTRSTVLGCPVHEVHGVRCLYKCNSVMCKVAAVAIIYIHRYCI